MEHQFFATCPKGLEALLFKELGDLGSTGLRETVAGVYFEGDLSVAYRACLWSRLANKILLPLANFSVKNADDLYTGAKLIPWHEHMNASGTLLVDFNGKSDEIRNTQFGALKVKDAIVDALRETMGERPSIDKQNPDARINVRLSRDKAVVSLDLCGDSLHRRGYRLQQGIAPIKENLAAAILLRAGWNKGESRPLLDPMCGSGTFLIEAAMITADIAPNSLRKQFAFEKWLQHDDAIWQTLREEALERKQRGLAGSLPEIRGYDANVRVIRAAEENIVTAGLDDWLRVTRKEIREFKKPTHKSLSEGLIVCNPPYGERLGEVESLKLLYAHLGGRLRLEFMHWQAAIFTGNPILGKQMGLRVDKKYKFFNGLIPSELLFFRVEEENTFKEYKEIELPLEGEIQSDADVIPRVRKVLTPGAQMLVNRLQKNLKKLKRWANKKGVNCYRVYDADMPEYSAAIDIYTGNILETNKPGTLVHVQEYAAPKSIDENKAYARFEEIKAAVPVALNVSEKQISYKQRRRNRGKEQYEKITEFPEGDILIVNEGVARLQVNLWKYLDSGLFLDHRPLRLMIAAQSKGKRFLNLFCYTAAASIQAALGGARYTVSIDMSQTYLDWARKNLALNGLSESRNRLERADCIKWLKDCDQTFDLILLDPPSFSNSKRMEDVLDIQRDHVTLIRQSMSILSDDGLLYFSNNLRSFKLSTEVLDAYNVINITANTIEVDFEHKGKVHQCWEIRHK